MTGPSERQGGRMRTRDRRRPHRLDRHRDHLLAGLAAADLTGAATATVLLGARSTGIVLALFVASIAGAYAIESA